ncbi:hypothetical protein J1TS5_09890 [Paenibacillus macerans]|nr:hypothetical protein J1TS5_09890 [Paenibacillus macerans]
MAVTAHPNLFGFSRPSPLNVMFTSFAALDAFGVGHNTDSFSWMRGADSRSRKSKNDDLVTDVFKVLADTSE